MLSKAASLSALSTRDYLKFAVIDDNQSAEAVLNAEGIFQDVIARKVVHVH
jgi:hypothetical protein